MKNLISNKFMGTIQKSRYIIGSWISFYNIGNLINSFYFLVINLFLELIGFRISFFQDNSK